MKKVICLVFSALLVLSLSLGVYAEEVCVDETFVIDGMEKSFYQGYEPTIRNNTMTLCLPICAQACVGDVTVSIALDDPDVFLLAAQPKDVTVSEKDGIYPAKLTLSLQRTRRNGDYPATVTVRGTDEQGKQVVGTIPYIIRIRDGYASHETLKPILSEISTELNVGSEGTFSLTVTNPTTTQSITDAWITVTDALGEIVMTGSNRIQLPEILPGESLQVNVPMTVKANAAISLHTLEVKLSYRALGQTGEWTEQFTCPVTQSIRLEQGGVQMETAVAGELGNMTLPLMNMGKGELSNVLVTLEIDGVVDAQSVLVGTMAAGESKQAKLTFTPGADSVGTHSGVVTITCEDAYGNAFSRTIDVTLSVDEPIPEVQTTSEEQEKTDPMKIVLGVLCVLLVAGMIIEGKILTDKLHKLEEERL